MCVYVCMCVYMYECIYVCVYLCVCVCMYVCTYVGRYVCTCIKVKVIPRQAEVAQGVPGRLRPRIFLTFRHYKGGRSPAIRTGRLYPRRNPWCSFSEADSTPGHMVLSGGATEKNPQ